MDLHWSYLPVSHRWLVDYHTNMTAEGVARELATEVVRSFGVLRFRATGSSMLPAIWPGDIVLVQRRRIEEIGVGEIVLFRCYGRLVSHRVIAHLGTFLVTQGDTIPQADPPVMASELLGTVTEIVQRGKRISPSTSPRLPGRIAAALLRRSSLASRALQRAYAPERL
jgi:signal peptidase I